MAAARLLPELTDENRAFWTGGADGALLIAQCDACGNRIHPPQPICPKCLGRSVTPRPALGTGSIYSYTINHQAWLPGLEVPYALAVVDLDDQDGLRLTANVVGSPLAEVAIGRRVTIDFEQHEDVWIPIFRLAGTPAPV